MPGRGKPRVDAKRVKRSKRQAESRDSAAVAPKQKKRDGHEVVETISLADNSIESGISRAENGRPEGIIHFDDVFKNVQLEFNDSMPEIEPLRCPGADMAVHVPKQIQDKIMSHQYINLALLLKGSLELAEICSGATLHINEKGSIESRPKVTKQAIRNIDEWTDAFIVFASIYLQKYHDKSIDILRYMSIIRETATRYPTSAWRTYDEQFRLRQVSKSTRQSWGSLNGELWLRVMTIPHSNAAGLGSMVKPVTPIHQNSLTCNAFNDGNCTWNSCKFRHVCSACNSTLHGRRSCPHVFQGNAAGQLHSYTPQNNRFFRGRGFARGHAMSRGRFNRR